MHMFRCSPLFLNNGNRVAKWDDAPPADLRTNASNTTACCLNCLAGLLSGTCLRQCLRPVADGGNG
eukprot:11224599-Lingulodinium_polyedra.AAC.1